MLYNYVSVNQQPQHSDGIKLSILVDGYVVVARFTKCSVCSKCEQSVCNCVQQSVCNCGFMLPLTCIHLCILEHQIMKVIYNYEFE